MPNRKVSDDDTEGPGPKTDPVSTDGTSALGRRDFVKLTALGVAGGMAIPDAAASPLARENTETNERALANTEAALSVDDLRTTQKVAGLSFRDEHLELMLETVDDRIPGYEQLRSLATPNDLIPALQFDPTIGGTDVPTGPSDFRFSQESIGARPLDDDLAFLSVAELSSLIGSRVISVVELTTFFLERLDRVGRDLEAVVTITHDRALDRARRADGEIANGIYRGPLHGIPYGAKDLLAVAGYPTTWGAVPFKDQVLPADAAVVQKLDDAGAILVAKLTLGALAWGDVWFGGKTRNPWNIDQGSSGSSAGPGAAVSAGVVPFAIGSETLGSIVSPSTRNGVCGLRPTFGTVSRAGAMTLSWSLDKLGPMARSALDCAIVYNAIRGADRTDPSTVDARFNFNDSADITNLRVGFLADVFERDYPNREADEKTLGTLRDMGVKMTAVSWPDSIPTASIMVTLSVEAAAAFDDLTRNDGVDAMVRQERNAWPNEFRAARFVPAVEYLQANRHRVTLMRMMNDVMKHYDVVVCPTFGGSTLQLTNLTGHPAVCVPNNFLPVEGHPERRNPQSITFIGSLYGDAAALRLAHAYQQQTNWHRQRPPVR